jgi:hypothetical protein
MGEYLKTKRFKTHHLDNAGRTLFNSCRGLFKAHLAGNPVTWIGLDKTESESIGNFLATVLCPEDSPRMHGNDREPFVGEVD